MTHVFVAPSKLELRIAAVAALLGFAALFAVSLLVRDPDEPGVPAEGGTLVGAGSQPARP